MKKKTFSLLNKIISVTVTLVSIVLLLNFSGCCEDGGAPPGSTQSVENDVQTEMNVDMTNPIAVDMAILTAQKMGNSEVADALIEARSIKRADYQQKADDAKTSGDYEEAIKNYDQAIKYSDPGNANQKSNMNIIYSNLAVCNLRLSFRAQDDYKQDDILKYCNKVADSMISAARYRDQGDSKADAYMLAAEYKYKAEKKSEVCGLLTKAKASAVSDKETIAIMKKQTDYNCK